MTKPDSHYADIATERCAEQDKQRYEDGYRDAQAAMQVEVDRLKQSFEKSEMYIHNLEIINLEHKHTIIKLREALRPLAECYLPPEGHENNGVTAHFTVAQIVAAKISIMVCKEKP